VDVSFDISKELLGFYGAQNTFITESGEFHVWIGENSVVEKYATLLLD
jgi:hypothetical protein